MEYNLVERLLVDDEMNPSIKTEAALEIRRLTEYLQMIANYSDIEWVSAAKHLQVLAKNALEY